MLRHGDILHCHYRGGGAVHRGDPERIRGHFHKSLEYFRKAKELQEAEDQRVKKVEQMQKDFNELIKLKNKRSFSAAKKAPELPKNGRFVAGIAVPVIKYQKEAKDGSKQGPAKGVAFSLQQ